MSSTKLDWISALGKDPQAASDRENWPSSIADSRIDWKATSAELYGVAHCDVGGGDSKTTRRGVKASIRQLFPPRYREARSKLDYVYHPYLHEARLHLQDQILSDFDAPPLQESSSGSNPWVVFTAGAMGVGKSFVLKTLEKYNLFPLQEFVFIDPDQLKVQLPEVRGYTDLDVESAATKLHRESTMMADVLFEHSLLAGRNTLVDGSFRDRAWHKQLFRRIRSEYPRYRIAIIHITAPTEAIFARAAARAQAMGRVVPSALLESSLQQVPLSVKELSPDCDFVAVVANDADGGPPVLKDLKIKRAGISNPVTVHPSWNTFQAAWKRPVQPPAIEKTVVEKEQQQPKLLRAQDPPLRRPETRRRYRIRLCSEKIATFSPKRFDHPDSERFGLVAELGAASASSVAQWLGWMPMVRGISSDLCITPTVVLAPAFSWV